MIVILSTCNPKWLLNYLQLIAEWKKKTTKKGIVQQLCKTSLQPSAGKTYYSHYSQLYDFCSLYKQKKHIQIHYMFFPEIKLFTLIKSRSWINCIVWVMLSVSTTSFGGLLWLYANIVPAMHLKQYFWDFIT